MNIRVAWDEVKIAFYRLAVNEISKLIRFLFDGFCTRTFDVNKTYKLFAKMKKYDRFFEEKPIDASLSGDKSNWTDSDSLYNDDS